MVTISTNQQANEAFALIRELKPKVGAFDTETTGLHIILDKPFVYQFGFIHPTTNEIYSYAVDIEQQPMLARAVIKAWQKCAAQLDIYLGHNVKFDLHMEANYGEPYTTENLSDTMFYIRYAHDTLAVKNGGPPLGLKLYATKYIDPNAKLFQKELKSEQSQIAKDLNRKLAKRLKAINPKYTVKELDKIFKDPVLTADDLPDEIKAEYSTWLNNDVPEYIRYKVVARVESDFVPYNKLDRATLMYYAHYDIIYTLKIYQKLEPIIKTRGMQNALDLENKLIMPLFEMERVGFKTDKTYLLGCQERVKEYIKERRTEMNRLANEVIKVGQHAKIKLILNDEYDLEVVSTGSEELNQLKNNLIRTEGGQIGSVQFIDVVQELRTLEKWYSTYIIRFLRDLQTTDRLYTMINQVGTVSGRVTSDFQQFPKEAITTKQGEELFHPRKMVVPTGGEYNDIVYLDYSQIELRFQAFYTILCGNPDTNLCRAYMPYLCVDSNGKLFDHTNPDDIIRWDEKWYLKEDRGKEWTPVDVHGATTEHATGLTPDHPDFKKLRTTIGKRTNFAKNYGAKYNKIKQMFPEKTEEEIRRIDNAYYLAFPGVKAYQNYCYGRADQFSYTENLFGIKYYNVNGHNLINMLIQGSAAYYLKHKIRELYEYSKKNVIKSRFQMNIHDELSWERHYSESTLFFAFKRIMEDWPAAQVPIVADMEITSTTWAGKKEVKTIDEFHAHFISRPFR